VNQIYIEIEGKVTVMTVEDSDSISHGVCNKFWLTWKSKFQCSTKFHCTYKNVENFIFSRV